MGKKDFIALADMIRYSNHIATNNGNEPTFSESAINDLAIFCRSQNSAFMRDRWLDYIAGDCGPNGGKVKK